MYKDKSMPLYEAIKHHRFSHVRDQAYCISQVSQRFPSQHSSIVWDGVVCPAVPEPKVVSVLTATQQDHHGVVGREDAPLYHQACYCRTPGPYTGKVIIFPFDNESFQGPTMHFFFL